jgi:PIN domain nuclease of toxin-antitoxin system
MGYLLDTHEWLWFLQGDATKLTSATVEEFLTWQRQGTLFVSAVSIWEIAVSVSKGRLDLGTSVENWVQRSVRDGGLNLLPLTASILIESTRLPGYAHKDPGDRMLMATALEHDLILVTRDAKILPYGAQGHVKVLAR